MKELRSLVSSYLPNPKADKDSLVEGLLHRGKTFSIPPTIAGEIVCSHCGGTHGYVCRSNGIKVWFCGNKNCLETDVKIIKKREHEAKRIKF